VSAPAPPALSVVVPAFDEAAHVRGHLVRILHALARIGRPFEILLVDDGSRDATAAEAEAVAREDDRVVVLRHATNRGKGAALATGCARARGDLLAFLDADLEIAPEEIAPLLARMERDGADLAVGSKYVPGAVQRRPWRRLALSRVYLAVTSVLFRLPIRDTQTGLKLLRRDLAAKIVPAIVTTRWAWDVELLLLAHRLGARIVAGPVTVDFDGAGARIGLRGFLASGLDTARAFLRDRGLAAYGPALARARGTSRPGRPAPVAVVTGDDLGMSAGVDRGLVEAAAAGRLTAASWLADGPTAVDAAARVRAAAPDLDVGVHLDLAPRGVARFLLGSWLGVPSTRALRASVRAQIARARVLGLHPTHVDAHRHAFLWPRVYRACAAEARAQGLIGIRQPTPVGAWRCGAGGAGLCKGVLLAATGLGRRGIPHAYGLAAPAGIVDAAQVVRWARRGRWPRALLARPFEIVAHPSAGPDDVPYGERGVDRAADAATLAGLPGLLAARGVRLVAFPALPVPRRGR